MLVITKKHGGHVYFGHSCFVVCRVKGSVGVSVFLMKSGDVEARNSTKQFYKRRPKPRVTCRRVDRYLTHFGPGPTAALLYSSSAHVYNMLYHVLRMPDALPHDAAVDILWFKVKVRFVLVAASWHLCLEPLLRSVMLS